MSFSVWLEIAAGDTSSELLVPVGDVTYNLSPMFAEALMLDEGLRALNRQSVGHALPRLIHALEDMRASPDKYRAMSPPSGWGTYEGARAHLAGLVAACRANPNATIRVQ